VYCVCSYLYNLSEVDISELLDAFWYVVTGSLYWDILVFVEVDTGVACTEQLPGQKLVTFR